MKIKQHENINLMHGQFLPQPNGRRFFKSLLGKVKKRLHIGFDDPAEATGTEAEISDEFRRIREEIKNGFFDFYENEINTRT